MVYIKNLLVSQLKNTALLSLLLIAGCTGDDGKDGINGTNGLDGKDGAQAAQIGSLGSGAVLVTGISNSDPKESIYVRKVGNGSQTIVLIPGNNTSGSVFDGMLNLFRSVDKFNDTYTVYTFDYRGSGNSSYNSKIGSLRHFAQDFEKVMNSISDFPTENVTLVGYSMGFSVALELAVINPNRFSKLIGLAPVGTRGVRVQFNASSAGTDELGTVWQSGDVVPVSDDSTGIIATAFQQRSWQGENRTFENVQFTWDLVVFNDILKINPLDFSSAATDFKNSPNYTSTLNDVLNVQYMPESLYYTHKFNMSPLDGGSYENSSGESVTINGDGSLSNMLVGKDVLLVKAKTDFLNWRGDLVITDNVIASSKYDLKQAGAKTTAVLIAPDSGYDHGLAIAKPKNMVNIIDLFIQEKLTKASTETALSTVVDWYDNDESEFESASY